MIVTTFSHFTPQKVFNRLKGFYLALKDDFLKQLIKFLLVLVEYLADKHLKNKGMEVNKTWVGILA